MSGLAAASFGVSRTYATTVERLWAAFTRPEELALWYMPPSARLVRNAMNLSVGGTYVYGLAMPDGGTMWGKWDISRVEPPALLTFVQCFTDEAGALARNPHDPDWPRWLRSEFRFAMQGGGATVTVNAAPLDPSGAETAAFRKGLASMSQGWERVLDALEARLTARTD
jgi:uncharacterized protein YndB with AHSA1/START domain